MATAVEPDIDTVRAGVIEKARRRQRRRRTTLAGAALALVAGGLAVASMGGSRGGAGSHGELQGPPLRFAIVHGRPYVDGRPWVLSVRPSLQAGNVGVCVIAEGGGSCNGPYAGPGRPLFGEGGYRPEERVGPRGEVDHILTAPGVAAVRVSRIGTLRPLALPGLPPGDGAVVFYRPPGSLGTVLPPGGTTALLGGFGDLHRRVAIKLTPLDAAGRPIASPAALGDVFQLPASYWQAPQEEPRNGRCALSAGLPGTRVEWGLAATHIAPDRSVTGTAFLTCLQVWYGLGTSSFQIGVLLNAQHPGAPPAPLWNASPLAGHPGIVQIPAVYGRPPDAAELARMRALHAPPRFFHPDLLDPPGLARREGDAWLLVLNGTLEQRLRFLASLRIVRGPGVHHPRRL